MLSILDFCDNDYNLGVIGWITEINIFAVSIILTQSRCERIVKNSKDAAECAVCSAHRGQTVATRNNITTCIWNGGTIYISIYL